MILHAILHRFLLFIPAERTIYRHYITWLRATHSQSVGLCLLGAIDNLLNSITNLTLCLRLLYCTVSFKAQRAATLSTGIVLIDTATGLVPDTDDSELQQ